MYDDGHVYTDKAGSLKNAAPVAASVAASVAAPVAEAKAEKAPESKSLMGNCSILNWLGLPGSWKSQIL